jgi:hypothetical protein
VEKEGHSPIFHGIVEKKLCDGIHALKEAADIDYRPLTLLTHGLYI